MNPLLEKLHSYPFEKLNTVKQPLTPNTSLSHIALSIGEPKHEPPEFVLNSLTENIHTLSQYPTTKGTLELRQAICQWLSKRFTINKQLLNAEQHVLPVNGTREAIFSFTQAVIDNSRDALVISPNPFYQIYEGATLLSGAQLKLLNCIEENNYLPDFSAISEKEWQRCQLLFLCSPGNPTGQLISLQQYQQLLELSERYNFVIASDECYSEIYQDENNPPTGLLEACTSIGRDDFKNCIVFHSLSKRSNLPGLRSGFIAGDKQLIQKFLLYRTYHGCVMSLPTQIASTAAWQDEAHVKSNRDLYREKYRLFKNTLDKDWSITQPPASFYLWAKTPIDDVQFASQLFEKQHITVLPGSFLARTSDGINPGKNHIRMALVASIDECQEAALRLQTFIREL